MVADVPIRSQKAVLYDVQIGPPVSRQHPNECCLIQLIEIRNAIWH